jgi:predicted hydrocarbon binding protein
VTNATNFCYRSGGFHKKTWELIYQQPIKVEVLESDAQGDDGCRFVIQLPESTVDKKFPAG